MTKRIAIIGSSGGGSGALGCNDNSIGTIISGFQGIQNIDKVIATDILFIVCNQGMDIAKAKDKHKQNSTDIETSLWSTFSKVGKKFIQSEHQYHCELNKGEQTLYNVNKLAKQIDEVIANNIRNGNIDALISISSDPEGVNKNTILAAIEMNIPIVGTGGTSMSYIQTAGGRVVGCSGGSIATTAISRSLCFGASLAAYWNVKYKLVHTPEWPKLRSVCGAAIPILLAVTLSKLVLQSILSVVGDTATHTTATVLYQMIAEKLFTASTFSSASFNHTVFTQSDRHTFSALFHQLFIIWIMDFIDVLEYSVIPVTISALACLEGSKLGEISMISGAVTGALLSRLKLGLLPAYIGGS